MAGTGTAAQVTALTTGCAGSTNVIGVATGTTIGTGLEAEAAKLKCCDNSVCCAAASTTDICCATGSTFAKAPAKATASQTTQVDLTAGGTPPKACLDMLYCTTGVVSGQPAVAAPGTVTNRAVSGVTCCDSLKNSCCPSGLVSDCCISAVLYVNTLTTVGPPADYSVIKATPIPPSPASACPVPAPTPSPPAAPEPVPAPVTNTDTLLPAALTAFLAALVFLVLFFGLPVFGAAGLGRKKRSLKKESDINDRLNEATTLIKKLIEAAQESYGTEADC